MKLVFVDCTITAAVQMLSNVSMASAHRAKSNDFVGRVVANKITYESSSINPCVITFRF
ncbi:hypothetical protein IWQ48_003445 [Labrenzia sp. EL_13]|nr:hypothetical protein [Labrenzia sp. EL_13]